MSTIPSMLCELLFRSAERYPELPCLGFVGEEPLSYTQVAVRVDELAVRLSADGIQPGDRVAIIGENMPSWGIAYLAINSCGAVCVPVLPDFSVSDITSILAHAEISACLYSRRHAEKLSACSFPGEVDFYLLDTLERVGRPGNEMDRASAPDQPRIARAEARSAEATPVASTHDSGPAPSSVGSWQPRNRRSSEDLAVLVYTSGTTGHSKGVMLSNGNLIFDAMAVSSIPRVKAGETFLSILPLAHTYECTVGFLSPISMGLNIIYLKRPPSATVLLPALKKVRPNLMLSVPLLIEKLYRQSVLPTFKANPIMRWIHSTVAGRKILNRLAGRKMLRAFGGRLYFFGIGGAPPSPEIEDFLREARFPYCVGYGLTETSPVLAAAHPTEMRPRSTGRPVEGIEITIAEHDAGLQEGEILVRGPVVMQGYYKDPELTATVMDSGGWFHTGDLGYFDEDGYLYVKGRVKTMILGPAGENIYPEAIESIINSYDFVEDSLVFHHEGQLLARIHVDYEGFLQSIQGLAESAAEVPRDVASYLNELRKKVNEHLSSFSRIGTFIEQPEPFEKTPTQKIKRFLYDTLHIDDPGRSSDAQGQRPDPPS